ncbi:DUF5053 domain-containing protein [Bacteroides sp. 519]|uniref:DUF5053 domain-containing protein n=1 Tax=Bacteroides sp. 519 TaxID=2302937 RepID=UPI0013D15909|nr:DUF5053 domain-containing protein [Bacteroides sp. 519]
MKEIDNDLQELKKYIGLTDDINRANFNKQLDLIASKYTSSEDKQVISEFINKGLSEAKADIEKLKKQAEIIKELKTISEIVSFSYIAKNYFHKTKAWLSQRMNGNKVHGKTVYFTENELETLRFAIKDISNKLGSLSLS